MRRCTKKGILEIEHNANELAGILLVILQDAKYVGRYTTVLFVQKSIVYFPKG